MRTFVTYRSHLELLGYWNIGGYNGGHQECMQNFGWKTFLKMATSKTEGMEG
jgi:hypothetical protein